VSNTTTFPLARNTEKQVCESKKEDIALFPALRTTSRSFSRPPPLPDLRRFDGGEGVNPIFIDPVCGCWGDADMATLYDDKDGWTHTDTAHCDRQEGMATLAMTANTYVTSYASTESTRGVTLIE